jgi:methyl-accepting chemotaxis protein
MAVSDFYIQATLLSETDLRGTITFVNDTFCEVSKYSREELIGKPHNIIRHPDTPKKLFELWWETIKRGEVFRAVIKNKAKDDAHYWVQVTIMPIKNKNGEVVKYIAARHLLCDEEKARELYDLQAKAMQL